MKTNLLPFLAAVLLAACQGKAEKTSPVVNDTTTTSKVIVQATPFNSSSIKTIDPADVDPSQPIAGEMTAGISWEDQHGQNTVVLAQAQSEEEASASLYAFQYVQKGSAPIRQLWKLTDGVAACEFDIVCRFVKESLTVTDLDKDNIGEVWLVYYQACKSDVSPSTMKLMMYEGGSKYAARGETLVDTGGGAMHGGAMTMDVSLQAAGKVFTDFAKAHWEKHVKETF